MWVRWSGLSVPFFIMGRDPVELAKRAKYKPPDRVRDDFAVIAQEVYDIEVPFTRESWHGRMKTCRGVGASLSEKNSKMGD